MREKVDERRFVVPVVVTRLEFLGERGLNAARVVQGEQVGQGA